MKDKLISLPPKAPEQKTRKELKKLGYACSASSIEDSIGGKPLLKEQFVTCLGPNGDFFYIPKKKEIIPKKTID